MKGIKTEIINWRNSKLNNRNLLRSYPTDFSNISLFVDQGFNLGTNFITKLKNNFGGKVQIFIFVLNGSVLDDENHYNISAKDFNLFGKFKNKKITERLKCLDLLIDMTSSKSSINSLISNLATNAYKVKLGNETDHNYNTNLCIHMNNFNQDLFADEIIKYHNILKNG